jgi:malate dehydrogenase
VGAAGGIGQPLSLLLKSHPSISDLRLYDVAEITVPAEKDSKEPPKKVATVKGVAADVSHVNSNSKTSGYGPAEFNEALKGCDVVVVPAGVPRKPGMTRDDLFNMNAGICANIAKGVAKACPGAILCVISNPVNSTVPIFAEILKKNGVYDPKRLFGVTALDLMRAATFFGEAARVDIRNVKVPVVGGHAGATIVPLFSQAEVVGAASAPELSQEELEKLTKRTMYGGDEVVAAKAGNGSATLSMAQAGAEFVSDVLDALNGKTVETYAFVESKITKASFFSSKLRLGRKGVDEVLGLGDVTPYEQKLVDAMLAELSGQIEKGIKFAADSK